MQPSVQQPISKDKNVMVQTRKYYLKNHYLTLKSKDKVTGRSLWDVTHRLMVMRPHTKYHWPISKETIIWPWGQRSRSNKGHYGMRHTALWSCTYIPNSIDLSRKTKMLWPGQQNTIKKNIIWPWRQRSRSHKGHYGTQHTVLWSCTHIPNIIDLSRKTKNVMARTRKYYLKNNYLTFMSKVKVQRRSLRYVTHRLMDMHPHTKYHWPNSKETIIWPWGQRTRSNEGHYGTWHTALWSYTHIPNIIDLSQDKNVMAQTRKYYLKNNYLTLRSKVKVPGRSLWYTSHRLMVMHPYQISLTYLKRNNYLTLRSKVKVQ